MRNIFLQFSTVLLLAGLVGCNLPQLTRPMNLYDIRDGSTIGLYYLRNSRDHGTISSPAGAKQNFHGECIFSGGEGYAPPNWKTGSKRLFDSSSVLSPNNFAEAYGFSKDVQVKPVGTGIVVGEQGTIIELVFYHYSTEIPNSRIITADGIGRDNNGRYYRVFLSTEED